MTTSPDLDTAGPLIEQELEQLVLDERLPGLSVGIVVEQDLAWFRGLGTRDLATGEAADEHTLHRVASITKTLTTAAVLQLRDDLSLSDRENRCLELMDELHIEHVKNQLGISLSGGERRRVEIARSLAMEPKYILLDEPFAGVDPVSVIDIQKIVFHLKNKNIGVLITDHNVRETLGICDRAYILNEGQMLTEGKPEQIISNPDVKRVYLGQDFSM